MEGEKIIALVTVELPFKLSVETGNYSLYVGGLGRLVPFRILSNHVWALGFTDDLGGGKRWLYLNPDHYTLVPAEPEPWSEELAGYPGAPRSLREWKEALGLSTVFVVPAGAFIQFPFAAERVPDDAKQWLQKERFPEVALEVVNDIITRYRVAQGLCPEAGYVSPVSEFELLELSVQFFEGVAPRSPKLRYSHGMPGPRFARPLPEQDDEFRKRFQLFLQEDVPPLPARMAFDAYSGLYRRRYDEALLGFWQALEMAVNWAEKLNGVKWSRNRPVLERRVRKVLETAGLAMPSSEAFAALTEARRLRNRIVHGSDRLRSLVPNFTTEGPGALDEAVSRLVEPLALILDLVERGFRRHDRRRSLEGVCQAERPAKIELKPKPGNFA